MFIMRMPPPLSHALITVDWLLRYKYAQRDAGSIPIGMPLH